LRCGEQIYLAAFAEVDPENLIKKDMSLKGEELVVQHRSFDLSQFDNVYLVAIGKAAPFMAKVLKKMLGDRIRSGIYLFLPETRVSLPGLTALPTSHPLPDEKSMRAAARIMALAKSLGERDLLFVLISGGGSAQVAFPAEGVSLSEKRNLTDRLLKAGADIGELNAVRKHLSQIKGGRLAKAAFPATVISLVISDVIHNDLKTIASGPTYWDSSTFQEAFRVLKKYGLWESLPDSVVKVIQGGILKKTEETLSREDPVFSRVFHFILGDITRALKAAKHKAEQLGFSSFILTSSDQGEAKDMARRYLALISSLRLDKEEQLFPLCLLTGGELTVTVRGKGKGGRNQEFVLAALQSLNQEVFSIRDWLILSVGTDGIDGPTDAAGAWIDPDSLDQVDKLALDISAYLQNNDAYNFFNRLGRLILTGRTHTNVMDLRMFLFR
jgi:glycerate-2-kinase